MKYEITEEQIREAHNAACSELKQKIVSWFPECFKTKYEIGKWYKSGKSIINYQGGTSAYGYYSEADEWEDVNEYWVIFEQKDENLSFATEEEVFSMLKKEAEKRGFKKGVNFIGVIENSYGIKDHVLNTEIYFDSDKEGGLYASKGWIMKDGKWATIVETPKEMTLEEIEKQLGHKIKIVR